jgi:hypothetical protein
MRVLYEIAGKFEEAAPCDGLVNSQVDPEVTYRRSRVYDFHFDGDAAGVDQFVRHCLFDEIGQELAQDRPLWTGESLVLEVAMKPGALDLEKEAILACHRGRPGSGFTLEKFRLIHRFYFFGPVTEAVERRLVRDLVNPAIHTHNLVRSR